MTGEYIKVGDKLKVRSWEDMVATFQTKFDSYWGETILPPGEAVMFVSSMKKYCGKVITVSHILLDGNLSIKEDECYFWRPYMLEPLRKDTIAYYMEVHQC